MRKIPLMRLPFLCRQGIEGRQSLDCRLGRAGKRACSARGFLGGLGTGRECEGKKKWKDGHPRKAALGKASHGKPPASSCHSESPS